MLDWSFFTETDHGTNLLGLIAIAILFALAIMAESAWKKARQRKKQRELFPICQYQPYVKQRRRHHRPLIRDWRSQAHTYPCPPDKRRKSFA